MRNNLPLLVQLMPSIQKQAASRLWVNNVMFVHIFASFTFEPRLRCIQFGTFAATVRLSFSFASFTPAVPDSEASSIKCCRGAGFVLEGGKEFVMSGGTADFFYREARRLKYVARSAFKLVEIQKKHRIIRPGASVLDLGCAPGAFLQVACQSLGPVEKGGLVVGVDIKTLIITWEVDGIISEQKVKVPADHCDTRVRTVSGDVMQMSPAALASFSPSGKGYSVLVSDMCPSVSGIGSKDAALSAELGMCALHLAFGQPEGADDSILPETGGILLPGGSLVIKLLEGEESQGFLKLCKGRFQQLSWLRPKATRSTSREIYFIGKGRVSK